MKGSGFAKAAFVAALTGALLAAFAPTYTSCSADVPGTIRCGSATGFSVNGWWILIVVSVPVVLTLIPLMVRSRTAWIIAAVLLWATIVIALASIGMFFIPAAILMTVEAARRERVAAPAV